MRPLKRRSLPLPQIHLPLYQFGADKNTHSSALAHRMLQLGLFLGRQRVREGKGHKAARVVPLEAEPILRASLRENPVRVGKVTVIPERVCSIPFCTRRHAARGFCNIHYKRRWAKGLIEKCENHAPDPDQVTTS